MKKIKYFLYLQDISVHHPCRGESINRFDQYQAANSFFSTNPKRLIINYLQ